MRAAKRIVTEPLLHFAVLGTLLFAAAQWPAFDQGKRDVILVSAHQQMKLRNQWRRETGALPERKQFDALLEKHIDEEILVREAHRIGLAQSDIVVRDRLVKNLSFASGKSYTQPETLADYRRMLETANELGMAKRDLVVRRRLVQRMEHAIESQVQVSEAELQRWYKNHRGDFNLPRKFKVEQHFFSKDASGQRISERAFAALNLLQKSTSKNTVNSDPFLLNGALQWTSEKELQRQLGHAFASAVANAATGAWLGPVESIYGLHIIRVNHVSPGRVADFRDVRSQIVAAVYADKERRAVRAVLAQLRERYTIDIADLNNAKLSSRGGVTAPAS